MTNFILASYLSYPFAVFLALLYKKYHYNYNYMFINNIGYQVTITVLILFIIDLIALS